jgi:hypothetical protein
MRFCKIAANFETDHRFSEGLGAAGAIPSLIPRGVQFRPLDTLVLAQIEPPFAIA